MLSKKMTVSLMGLITILVLAFVVSPAMAVPFTVEFSYDEAENVDGRQVDVTMTFEKVVSIVDVRAHHVNTPKADTNTKKIDVIVVQSDFSSVTYRMMSDDTGSFAKVTTPTTAIDDFMVTQKDLDPTTPGLQSDGKTFTFTVPDSELPRDDPATTAVEPFANKVYLSITGDPADTVDGEGTIGVPSLDPSDITTSAPGTLAIDLRTVAPQDRDTPTVVSIQRLRPGSQTVVAAFQEAAVTGPFEVRIVLTEEPHEFDKFLSKINVTNGEKSGFVIGTPFVWHGGTGDDLATDTTEAAGTPIPGQAIIPHPIEGRYNHDGVVTASLGDTASNTTLYPPLAGVPDGLDEKHIPLPTGRDGLYHQCRVTISPHRRAVTVTVKIDEFHDGDVPRYYYYPHQVDKKPNGREQLHLPVKLSQFNLDDGRAVYLPHDEKAKITYAGTGGHYILVTDKMGSHVKYYYHEDTLVIPRENKPLEQTPAELLYNVRETNATDGYLPNLESFLINDGTIHLVSYVRDGAAPKYKMGDAYISEVMWGTDASQDPVRNSNWIEIRNGTSGAIEVEEYDWALWFYEAHETPPTAYPADSYYEGAIGQAGEIIDIIGTKASGTGLRWSIAGRGQSGRTNIDIARTETRVLAPTTPLISMYRAMVADTSVGAAAGAMMPGDGTMAKSWKQTSGPSVNVGGPEVATNLGFRRENVIVATPGAAPFDTPDDVKVETEEAAKKDKDAADLITNTGTIPKAGQIYISEVMFAGGGTLPQWIEISNGSRTEEVNLSGWTITVDNAAADADVSVGATAMFTISKGTTVSMSGQDDTPSTILVVTEKGRNSFSGPKAASQVIVLDEPGSMTEIDLILAGVTKGKYTLLSGMAFLITLAPPEPRVDETAAEKTARLTAEKAETVAAKTTRQATEARAAAERKRATDTVGNLGADGAAAWVLPMSEEGGRSSIIRRHVQVARGPSAPEDGTMMDNWVLASDTSFAQVTHIRAQSFYGAANDVGTPGFRPGGALPVELSHFRPARHKETGAVVITWSTQSELNNAGFFIKRSNQPDSEFKVINATMIAGAGTTSEKQFYTYTDTTAQPNVVYYYQIEDVSLDGNHQMLTRGIRLKGHVSVAGKATLTWGELKTSHE